MRRSTAIGIDLAWSPRNPTGLAVATVTDSEVEIRRSTLALSNAEILDFIRPYASAPLTIAIDAPTVVPHADKMRDCERWMHQQQEFRDAHAAPYPGTETLLGACNNGTPRGAELVALLEREFGVKEVGCPPARHSGSYAIEVFPAAAMVRLFNLLAPLPYKKKRGRTWEQCRSGLSRYLEQLRELRSPSMRLPVDLVVQEEKGKAFKNIEDRVDAVLCAYVGALAWLGKAECVGSVEDGYIVLPQARYTMGDQREKT